MKNKEYGIAIHWNYIGIAVVFFSILTVLVLYLPNMRSVDSTILQSIRLALSPFPSYIPIFISEFGRANYMLWPQITAGCTLVSHRYFLKAFMLIIFTQISFLLKDIIKDYICRPRPDGCGAHGFGFPSGHACTTMCFYGIIIYLIHYYVRSDFWRNFLVIFFGLWIFLCGVSRMWLGVHFLSDVVAGWLLGFILVNLYIIIDRSIAKG